MNKHLNLDYRYAMPFVNQDDLERINKEIKAARKQLENKTGLGKEYLGWLDLPERISEDEINEINEVARKIRKQSKILVVVGIGGSYLGAKAALEYLKPYFPKRKNIEVLFAGHNMSSTYLNELVDYLSNKDFSINVISKSGTTTEPAIAFRVLKKLLEDKYGENEASERIFATTDKSKGALRQLATENNYKTFVVPDDIGGRFSVLTPVGLLPIAASGINIKQMILGARAARKAYDKYNIFKNDVHMYVALRNLLYRKNYKVEMLVNYETKLNFFSEWWKQLFGESEGKDHKGLFVASASFSTDLHSLGQYIQDGKRLMFETVINIENPEKDIFIEENDDDLDGLNYLKHKGLDFVNKKALQGTLLAHKDGGVPNIIINVSKISPFTFGYLVYFFELAVGISGYLLGVNPFNQPGVEAYKKNMFALLGKPGFEKLKSDLEKKL
ncbi:MAG: glucose-6-phosphate isomerase [Candidatus Izemoplasmatales bacterium]|jgi:glucose-6-phosphate isomerase|nr:glucose-6-phosphate isomerase [Candidatus Izemoplasmatales bacterium]